MHLARLMSVLCLTVGLVAGHAAEAKMVARPIDWTLNGTSFRSVLIYDDSSMAKRPGLIMVPNWYGVSKIAIAKAEMIAGTSYVILLTDMYGRTIRPTSDAEATVAVKPLLSDRTLMRKRINYALDRLKEAAGSAPIDADRLAAIGFCFGGAAVLDLARSGAKVKAVVSFHGELTTDDPALARNIKARVLAMNGADDALTAPSFGSFINEMRGSPADWQFVVIGHAVHCFTETEATATTGMCRYDAKAAQRSYALMRQWLAASFVAP
jgi:dienelactone hydrolase